MEWRRRVHAAMKRAKEMRERQRRAREEQQRREGTDRAQSQFEAKTDEEQGGKGAAAPCVQ